MNNKDLQEQIVKSIEKWVGRNYGTQEVEDPSWNITALSRQVARDLLKAHPELGIDNTNYELTVLVPTELDAEEVRKKITEVIERAGGLVGKYEYEGKKRLAYTINNQEFAQYTYYELCLPNNNAPTQISTTLNIKDYVLRYLMVKKDTRR